MSAKLALPGGRGQASTEGTPAGQDGGLLSRCSLWRWEPAPRPGEAPAGEPAGVIFSCLFQVSLKLQVSSSRWRVGAPHSLIKGSSMIRKTVSSVWKKILVYLPPQNTFSQ